MIKLNKLGFALALTLASSFANAAVVHDTITGPANAPVGADNIPAGGYIANMFNTGTTHCTLGCTLADVTLFIGAPSLLVGDGTFRGYSVNLLADNGGTTIGAMTLGTLDIGATPINASEGPVSFASATPLALTHNTNYWIQLIMDGPTDHGVSWFYPNSAGPLEIVDAGGIMFASPNLGHMLTVEVTEGAPSAVPVPPAFVMMGTALAGLFARRKKAA